MRVRVTVLHTVVGLALLAGASSAVAAEPAAEPAAPPAAAPPAAVADAEVPDAGTPAQDPPAVPLAPGDFDFSRPNVVGTALEVPWGMAFLPDGSALVAERNRARIMQLRPGQPATVAATISGVSPTGEAGLLGIAVSPTYASDQFVYAYYTSSTDNRIVRFRLGGTPTQQVIFSGIPRASIHDGGRIAFGPDGMLYATAGDANNTANAQNLNSPAGKILRMRPDGTIPPDNPFANSRVYSLGHRNPQGIAWDPAGRLWAAEFGQNTFDEINLIQAGRNYGWPICEGRCSDTRFVNPLVTWSTAEASPSGIAIVGNKLFAAALRGQRLWIVTLNGNGGVVGSPTAVLQGTYGRLRTVTAGPDGHLWLATSNRDGRGSPAPTDDRVIRFPPLDTGGETVFTDDFEAARGWTVNPNGTDTATTGAWQRGDPQQTASGATVVQRGDTTSGVNCLVTGATAGASVGANDIDGGTTSIQSPAVALPAGRTLTLSFSWYLAHLNNASSADFLRIRVVTASSSTVVFQQLGAATTRAGVWATGTANLTSFAGQSVRVLVEAADAGGGSLVEAAVDDVRITAT